MDAYTSIKIIRKAWANWTAPETPKPNRVNCSDDDAMKIFNDELQMQGEIKASHGPEPMGEIRGIDKEAIILANLCLTATAIAIIANWLVK